MATNQKFREFRVNSLPNSGLQAGDRYYLSVGGGKYKTFIVSDSGILTGDAGAEFIEKDTMAQMRALSTREIWALENGYYKGVRLHGYYTKGDTPAPIEYRLSDTDEADDGGSVIEVGTIKLEHVFLKEVNTIYFGLSVNSGRTPLENSQTLQNAFNAANRYGVKRCVINEGEHIVTTPSALYSINDSTLTFEGSLKLADNTSTSENLTGCQLIRYGGNNITVYNQRLDGNRDNQAINPNRGYQFSFTAYNLTGLTFIGGWCRNSIQSHIQTTAEGLKFKDYEFDTCGEHGIYYTLSVGQSPIQNVYMENVIVRNFGLSHVGGSAITLRAVRNGVYNNCVFDPGQEEKELGITIISAVYNYRGATIQDNEEFKHTLNDCRILSGTGVDNGILCTVDDANPDGTTIEGNMEMGRGFYVNGGEIQFPRCRGVVEMNGVLINPPNPHNFNRFPRRMINCHNRNILRVYPDFPSNCYIEGSYFEDGEGGTVTNGVIFDFNSATMDSGEWTFKNNTFNNFNNSTTQGIIRNTSGAISTILDGNIFKNCNNAVALYSGSNNNVVVINNSDITNSGVTMRFNPQTSNPKIVAGNDFIKTAGTTAERPSGNNLYIGLRYVNLEVGNETVWDGSTWRVLMRDATTTVKGVVNQAAASADTANPSDAEPTKVEFDALLNELRDLKAKMRTAGLLAN